MIKIIYLIAYNTFVETIRNKILYSILLFVIIIIALSLSIGEWSVFAKNQVIQDFGLVTMSLSGLLLAIFIGVGMLGKEISSKTIYSILSKPISRSAVIIGKFFGLSVTLIINMICMATIFIVMLRIIGVSCTADLLSAILLTSYEMVLIISVALFFSTLTTPTLSAICTIAFYITGHFNDLLYISPTGNGDLILSILLKCIYFTIPNLEHFNIRMQLIYHLPLPTAYIPLCLIYGTLYIIFILIVSCIIFSKKDL